MIEQHFYQILLTRPMAASFRSKIREWETIKTGLLLSKTDRTPKSIRRRLKWRWFTGIFARLYDWLTEWVTHQINSYCLEWSIKPKNTNLLIQFTLGIEVLQRFEILFKYCDIRLEERLSKSLHKRWETKWLLNPKPLYHVYNNSAWVVELRSIDCNHC